MTDEELIEKIIEVEKCYDFFYHNMLTYKKNLFEAFCRGLIGTKTNSELRKFEILRFKEMTNLIVIRKSDIIISKYVSENGFIDPFVLLVKNVNDNDFQRFKDKLSPIAKDIILRNQELSFKISEIELFSDRNLINDLLKKIYWGYSNFISHYRIEVLPFLISTNFISDFAEEWVSANGKIEKD